MLRDPPGGHCVQRSQITETEREMMTSHLSCDFYEKHILYRI